MLKFNKNGEFKILLFGDLHEKDDYESNPKFKDMQKLMRAALEQYNPDICVFLGDICSSSLAKENPEAFSNMLSAIVAPLKQRGIPVYCIMGNHEHDPGIDKILLEAYKATDGVIMDNMHPLDGDYADYYELVYSSDGKRPVINLWMLDSNNLYPDKKISNYDFVHTNQLDWFEKTSEELKKLNYSKPIPSFIFQHIPVPEEYELLRKPRFWEIPVSVKGHNTREKNRYVLKKGCEGYLGEGPCAPDFNNGQFAVWKKVGGVMGAFFGHDHLNDFSGFVDGIYLAQHKTAGFRCYTDGCRSCVRLITVNEKEPQSFKCELKHFKEFGLKCESLGPVFKRISDRQSFYLNLLFKSLGAIAGAGVLIAAAKYFFG